jgi:hypothetical protein
MKLPKLKSIQIRQLLITIIFYTLMNVSVAQDLPDCLMSPPYLEIQAPELGFAALDSELFAGDCEAVDDSLWLRQTGEFFDLYVATKGPSGSGRYWNITVGLAEKEKTTPDRGFCLNTSTIGWRTLQNFSTMPLPWLSDKNENGLPEFILWDSFALHEDASMAEFGLIAWVYETDSKGLFRLNLQLSREMASEIAAEYHKPIKGTDNRIQTIRSEFARHLEDFVSNKCTVP